MSGVMSDSNPYSAPAAEIQQPVAPSGALAERSTRLGAAMIDGLIMIVIVGPLMWFTGYIARAQAAAMAGEMFLIEPILWTAAGFVLFMLVQSKPLKDNGQTWGKKLTNIKIVDLTGAKPPLNVILFKRYLPVQAISAIPKLGMIFALVNVLFIFSADRRCVHDRIAGTKVVKV